MYFSPNIVDKFKDISIEQFYSTSFNPNSPKQGSNSTRSSRLRPSLTSNRQFGSQLPSYSGQKTEQKQQMNNYFKSIWRQQSGNNEQENIKKPKKKLKKKKGQEFAQRVSQYSESVRRKNLESESFYVIGDNKDQNKTKKHYLYQSFEKSPLWRQSSATLRNTSYSFNFSKDDRFPEKRLQVTDKLALEIEIPSTLCKKTCTLGKGEKQYVHSYELRRNVENPPPGKYNISSNSNLDNVLNISLGTQEKFFEIDTTRKYPGPGTYNTREIPGKDKRSFSIGGQLKHFYEYNLHRDMPSCDKYYPQMSNKVQPSRYESITFGKGEKTNFANMNGVPGPGQYPCHSQFDKLTVNNKSYQILRKGRYLKSRQMSMSKDVSAEQTLDDHIKNNRPNTVFNPSDQSTNENDISTFHQEKQLFLKDMISEALQTCK